MAHIHPVKDAEAHFVIDPQTRVISTEDALETLIQGDHNSEVYSFEIPKLVDGHPMDSCNKIKVHYINVDSATKAENKGAYEVTDITALDDDTLVFTWLVSGNATQAQGPLSFLIEFSCLAVDGTIDYRWHTGIFSSIPVGQGMSNTDELVLKYPDILEQWKAEVMANVQADWNTLLNKPFGERTTYGDTLTWDGNTDGHYVVAPYFVHVSDIILTYDELVNGGTIAVNTVGQGVGTTPFEQSQFIETESGVINHTDGLVIIVPMDNLEADGTVFEKAGIYLFCMQDEQGVSTVYTSSFTINGYTGFEGSVRVELTPLPNKYLDIIETVGGDTLTWDGDTSGKEVFDVNDDGSLYYYKVSDLTPTLEDFANGYSIGNNVEMADGSANPIISPVEGLLMDSNGAWLAIISSDGFGVSKGIYIADFITFLTINGYTGFTKEQVKEEYLPSGATVFYMGSDESDVYLYADKDCTVKATKEEVKKALNGVMYVYCDGAYIPPVNIMDFSTHWGLIILLYYGGSTMPTELYTAEYTD